MLRVTKEGRSSSSNVSNYHPRAGRKYRVEYPVPFDTPSYGYGMEFIDDIVWAKPVESSKNALQDFKLS